MQGVPMVILSLLVLVQVHYKTDQASSIIRIGRRSTKRSRLNNYTYQHTLLNFYGYYFLLQNSSTINKSATFNSHSYSPIIERQARIHDSNIHETTSMRIHFCI